MTLHRFLMTSSLLLGLSACQQAPADTSQPDTPPAKQAQPSLNQAQQRKVEQLTMQPIKNQSLNKVEFVGQVVFKNLEGGFYAIYADNGGKYTPLNLPKDFAKHGLKVKVTGQIKDVLSITQHGKVLEISQIESLGMDKNTDDTH